LESVTTTSDPRAECKGHTKNGYKVAFEKLYYLPHPVFLPVAASRTLNELCQLNLVWRITGEMIFENLLCKMTTELCIYIYIYIYVDV